MEEALSRTDEGSAETLCVEEALSRTDSAKTLCVEEALSRTDEGSAEGRPGGGVDNFEGRDIQIFRKF